ncbi:MAG: recombination protein RecR [Cryomorphaceae bacterium]|nr:recombination protein RecR [Cryomorphaceae bacterium]
MEIQSKLIDRAVRELSKLPGLGRKSALRNILHLLRQEPDHTLALTEALKDLVENIQRCKTCHVFTEEEACEICRDPKRDHSIICVVEDIRDVLAIENTGQFKGVYHILGGLISPMEGIGPGQLTLASLESRINPETVKEVLLALAATAEGDTTNFYIYRKLQNLPIEVTTIARGISVGDDLEYADEITLARSILHRVAYKGS